jgi:hypothetical protein
MDKKRLLPDVGNGGQYFLMSGGATFTPLIKISRWPGKETQVINSG